MVSLLLLHDEREGRQGAVVCVPVNLLKQIGLNNLLASPHLLEREPTCWIGSLLLLPRT
jgi:hypothetical protein